MCLGWRSGFLGDERVYTVRYASHAAGPGAKYRYRNTTQMNCMIEDLRPNTRYEFSVRVTLVSPRLPIILLTLQSSSPFYCLYLLDDFFRRMCIKDEPNQFIRS
jgi:hypothetical protein